MLNSLKVGDYAYFQQAWHGIIKAKITNIRINQNNEYEYCYEGRFNVHQSKVGSTIEKLADNIRQFVIDDWNRQLELDRVFKLKYGY